MVKFQFREADLTTTENKILSEGFSQYNAQQKAPNYEKNRLCWLAYDLNDAIVGIIAADLLWDWIYIEDLWVKENFRNQGLGKNLMLQVEDYATSQQLIGIWLWTQSWQAADFYKKLEYQEFTRFNDFPRGHSRIGLRKILSAANSLAKNC